MFLFCLDAYTFLFLLTLNDLVFYVKVLVLYLVMFKSMF
jgi:hypothetical protein